MTGSLKRIGALFYARNLEFVRDRAALIWNLAFPLLLALGFTLIFSGPPKPLVQMGVVGELPAAYAPLRAVPLLKIIPYDEEEKGRLKVRHHQLDLLLSPGTDRYWINPDAPQGAMAEYLLRQAVPAPLTRETLSGRAIRYGDWLLPGVIGMNLMFSGLFGVGFVIVRYRKSGVLKRLGATPLSAAEFLCAQLLSRILITLVVSLLVFLVAYFLLGVPLLGSGWLLLLIALLGGASMASLGLLVAARIQGERAAQRHQHADDVPLRRLVLAGRGSRLAAAAGGLAAAQPDHRGGPRRHAGRGRLGRGGGATGLGPAVYALLHHPGQHPVQMESQMKLLMKSLPLVGGTLLALLLSLPASAGAMRCKNALITEGDSTAEMLIKCGEPMLREELTRNEENQFGNLVQVKYGERWTYNFGKNEFMRFVTVRNGVVTDIENGPRGN